MSISIVVAMSRSNRVIGRDGKLPWHLPSDLAHFKKLTWGHTVVMGRKTFESIPEKFRPLPGRINLVLSRDPAWKPVFGQVGILHPIQSWAEILRLAPKREEVFVIGGESVFKLALPVAKRLYLTTVETECDGDTFFPEFENNGWVPIERSSPRQEEGDEFLMSFSVYCHP